MAKRKDPWPASAASSSWAEVLKPAPGDLRIVQAFLNSIYPASKIEELASPRTLADWMTRWGLTSPGVSFSDDDFQLARQVRQDLRKLIGSNSGDKLDPEVLARLDAAARDAVVRVRFDIGGGARTEPAIPGFMGCLAEMMRIVERAHADDRWIRMKLCLCADCSHIYYDHSTNRAAQWCSNRCGNRHNARSSRRNRAGSKRRFSLSRHLDLLKKFDRL